MRHKTKQPPGTERKRDEAREGGGPRAAGGPWDQMDKRGDRRFGHTRYDDSDPLTMIHGDPENDDDTSPNAADPDLAAEEAAGLIESGGEHAGFGRGDKPRKPKARTKPNPKPGTKTKKRHR
jgi:hypothetical protein